MDDALFGALRRACRIVVAQMQRQHRMRRHAGVGLCVLRVQFDRFETVAEGPL